MREEKDKIEENFDPEELKEFGEIEKEIPLWKKVLWRSLVTVISLMAISGMIYFSGLRQYFFYRRTPSNIKVEEKESVLQAETITVPVVARILKAKNSSEGSNRNEENIENLITKANKIWAQADIELKLLETKTIVMDEEEIREFSDHPYQFTKNLEDFNENLVNAFFKGNLEGPSGLAYMGTGNILIADYTTSEDFLVFAHEIGHILGLEHTESNYKALMDPEAKESVLSEEAIKKARKNAKNFYVNE